MKVTVDLDRCQGYVCCLMEAPEVFDIDDEVGQAVVMRPEPGPELRDKVEAAVRSCPARAISMAESG